MNTKALTQHLTRCFVAGILALMPVGGTLLLVVYLESSIAGSWLARQPFYFPGCGLLLVLAVTYGVGLAVSTFVGRWIWSRADGLMSRLPLLGWTYETLKQILGYGSGGDALFQQVVLVPTAAGEGLEIGLVTGVSLDSWGKRNYTIFLPHAPTPTTGRMVMLPAAQVTPLDITPHAALRTLVSLGKIQLQEAES
jgi:uncharacterized membrane protein